MYEFYIREPFGMFKMMDHMQAHIKPSDWYNGKSRTFKKNKRKGK